MMNPLVYFGTLWETDGPIAICRHMLTNDNVFFIIFYNDASPT